MYLFLCVNLEQDLFNGVLFVKIAISKITILHLIFTYDKCVCVVK